MAVTIIDTLDPKNSGDFPTHRDTNGEGGYRAVADSTERDAIPTEHRKEGMLVYTQDDDATWVLGSGLTNGDWSAYAPGGGGGDATSIQGIPVDATPPNDGEVLVCVSGAAWVPTALAAVPTGTGFATVTSGAWDAAATANLIYTGGHLQTTASIYWEYAGITGALAWTPTGSNKTVTLPDATGTVVLQDSTDTLTNKTYSLSGTGNVLTDASIAQYDLIMANATPAFKRLAKGSNSTLLGVSSGGVVQYAAATVAQGGTGLTAMPGSASEIIINSAGTAYGAATNITAGSSYIGLGSGTLATAGFLRIAYDNAPDALTDRVVFGQRNSANTNNKSVISTCQDAIFFGGDTQRTSAKQFDLSRLMGATGATMGVGSSYYLHCTGSAIECFMPVIGSSGTASYFATHGVAEQAMADANQTAAAGVYKFEAIRTTGALTATRTLTLPTASSDLRSYKKTIINDCTGAYNVTVKCAAGTTIDVANGMTAIVFVGTGGVERVTADV